MLKKSLSIVILISMVLHCSSRLGFLSYLYEKRHTIAYSAGLIAEIPIAICKSDYTFNKSLKIHYDDLSQKMPTSFVTTYEINLFFQSQFSTLLKLTPADFIEGYSAYTQRHYQSPLLRKFHPPKI